MIRFRLVNKEPIHISLPVNGVEVAFDLPRFKRKDWKKWQNEEMQARAANAVEPMDTELRARTLMMYPPQPRTTAELRALVYTLDGTERVFKTCARRAAPHPVPEEVLAELFDEGDGGEGEARDFETIALMLASMADPDKVARELGLQERKDIEADKKARAKARRGGKEPSKEQNPDDFPDSMLADNSDEALLQDDDEAEGKRVVDVEGETDPDENDPLMRAGLTSEASPQIVNL